MGQRKKIGKQAVQELVTKKPDQPQITSYPVNWHDQPVSSHFEGWKPKKHDITTAKRQSQGQDILVNPIFNDPNHSHDTMESHQPTVRRMQNEEGDGGAWNRQKGTPEIPTAVLITLERRHITICYAPGGSSHVTGN